MIKRILYILIVLISSNVLLSSIAVAQVKKDERTTVTLIADLLAQLPARNAVLLEQSMKEVSALGEDGYVTLITGLASPEKANNALIEYVVAGYTAYATGKGQSSSRTMAINAYCKALAKISDKQNKAFIISQFDLIGNDAAVNCLTSFLADDQLADEASRALVKTGTPSAISALISRLPVASVKQKIIIAEALGHTRSKAAADALMPLVTGADKDLRKVSLYALAHIGDASAGSVLLKMAEENGYKYDQTNAVAALLVYAQNRAEADKAETEEIARAILKNATAPEQINQRIAALKLLSSVQTNQQALLAAMKDKEFGVRAAAVNFAGTGINEGNSAEWVKQLKKADIPTKISILDMLAFSDIKSALPAVLKLVKETNPELKAAAINAAVKLGEEAVIGDLLKQMNTGDTTDIAVISNGILRMKGEGVTPKVAAAIPGAKPAMQVALINILASRAASAQIDIAYDALNSTDAGVRQAAFRSLKYLATADNKERLFDLLNAATDPNELIPVQEAIIASLRGSRNVDEEANALLLRMATVSDDKKTLFYKILASIGGTKSLKAVVGFYATGNDATKKAALDALSSWTDASASDELIKIARTTSNPAHLNQSLNGYLLLIRKASYPAEQRLLLLRNAMALAKNPAQQKQILKDAEKAQCFNAIIFAGQYLDDPALQQAAANAVMNITMAGKYNGDVVKSLLNKTIEVITGGDAGYQKEGMRKYISEMQAGELPPLKPFELSAGEKKEGYRILFDGTNMDNWTGNTTDYIIENGNIAIRPQPGRGSGGNLFTKEQFGDFIFRVEFQLTPGANNGLGIRAPLEGDAAYEGMELQILDNDAPIYKDLKEYQYHGSVYGAIPAKRGYLKPVGEWNYQEVIVTGPKIKVILNGTVILDGDITPFKINGTPDHRAHPGLQRDRGHIGFLGHGSPVQFRNIRIKDLSKKTNVGRK